MLVAVEHLRPMRTSYISRIGSRKSDASLDTRLVQEDIEYMGTLGFGQHRGSFRGRQDQHEQDSYDISLKKRLPVVFTMS